MPEYYIGVDVGTGSARAALVQRDGILIASSTHDTPTWRDEGDHRVFEQSTTATWAAICSAVKEVVAESNVNPSDVKGLGFDATCSLAVTNMGGNPVCITAGENLGLEGERNIILWADHRAEKEAELINSTGSVVLDYVGGVTSVSTGILLVCTWWKLREIFVYFIAGDGDTEDSLAQEPHGARAFFSVPVFRSARLSDLPSDRKCCEVVLFSDVQMVLCSRGRVGRRLL